MCVHNAHARAFDCGRSANAMRGVSLTFPPCALIKPVRRLIISAALPLAHLWRHLCVRACASFLKCTARVASVVRACVKKIKCDVLCLAVRHVSRLGRWDGLRSICLIIFEDNAAAAAPVCGPNACMHRFYVQRTHIQHARRCAVTIKRVHSTRHVSATDKYLGLRVL